MNETPDKNKIGKLIISWLLWWSIDTKALTEEALKYETLAFFRTWRGASVLCLLFSIAVSAFFMYQGKAEPQIWGNAIIYAVLAFFIYRGHRWAMVSAMILWTLEKGYDLIQNHATHLFSIYCWWAIFMHAFYMAFSVENERRRLGRVVD